MNFVEALYDKLESTGKVSQIMVGVANKILGDIDIEEITNLAAERIDISSISEDLAEKIVDNYSGRIIEDVVEDFDSDDVHSEITREVADSINIDDIVKEVSSQGFPSHIMQAIIESIAKKFIENIESEL